MGYTHYWERRRELDAAAFARVVADFEKVVPALANLGVELAGWDGQGAPEISAGSIRFNGKERCGHDRRDLGITWPSQGAVGVCVIRAGQSDIGDRWFAGLHLSQRICGGDCSHETFGLERVYPPRTWDQPRREFFFTCCKTAYKPYDLAVNACLIIAKQHLKRGIRVRSDGALAEWEDAMLLCQDQLGYGRDFIFDSRGDAQ